MSTLATIGRSIWKYTVRPATTVMPMAPGARLLYAGVQRGEVCVWVEVDHPAGMGDEVPHRVATFPTGAFVPDGWTYLGTVQMTEDGMDLVFHVYDGGEIG